MSHHEVELLVIGGGTAGLLAAQTARGLGAEVVLVERSPAPGGDCLWTGCVPSKTLLSVADEVAVARRLTGGGPAELAAVRARVERAVQTIAPVDSAAALERSGVTVRRGAARFFDERTVLIDDAPLRFGQAVIATGAGPAPAPFPSGAGAPDPLTSDTVWDLLELPAALVVVGGGTGGCEFAQAFARLGTAVTLVESGDRLLPEEIERAATLVTAALDADGVQVLTGRTVVGSRPGAVQLDDGRLVPADRVLVSAGRLPRTSDLDAAAAGVQLDPDGYVRTDAHLRTANPRIWAAGDVTGRPHLTHRAGVQGSTVAFNAVLGLRRTDPGSWPRVTFTRPEVASVGLDPRRLPAGGRVVELDHAHVDRAVTEQAPGFTSVVLDRRGRVRGGVVVSPRAGETVGEIALAVAERTSIARLATATHPYPTFSDGFWNVGVRAYREQLAARPSRWLLAALRRARRRRLAR